MQKVFVHERTSQSEKARSTKVKQKSERWSVEEIENKPKSLLEV